MSVFARSKRATAEAHARNNLGMTWVIGGFCVIIIAITAEAEGPVVDCHCWNPLFDPAFIITAAGHIASSVMIYIGAKKMDW